MNLHRYSLFPVVLSPNDLSSPRTTLLQEVHCGSPPSQTLCRPTCVRPKCVKPASRNPRINPSVPAKRAGPSVSTQGTKTAQCGPPSQTLVSTPVCQPSASSKEAGTPVCQPKCASPPLPAQVCQPRFRDLPRIRLASRHGPQVLPNQVHKGPKGCRIP